MCGKLLRRAEKKVELNNPKAERYFLSKNPFPPVTTVNINSEDERENGSIYLEELRCEEQKNFKKLFSSDNTTDINRISFLMDYQTAKGRGIGKTAFLNHQRQLIMKDFGDELSNGESVMFAIHLNPTPSNNYNSFWKISKLIIETLITQNIISNALCRILALEGLITDEILENPEVNNDLLSTLGNDEWLEKQNISIFTLQHKLRLKLSKININDDLLEYLVVWGRNSDAFYTNYFKKITDFQFRKDQSSLLFNDIVRFLEFAGFNKGIVLFDELEKVISPLNKNDRRNFVDSLRFHLFDDSNDHTKLSFFHFLFVIHPYLQEILLPHWDAAGLDRVASIGGELATKYTILFNPIEEYLAITLAKTYIEKFRINKEKCPDEIYPFTEKALYKAHEHEQGIPGRYLQLLYHAMENCIDNNWSNIDEKKIESILGKKSINQSITLESPVVDLME